jgi:hypothetical protein
MQQYIKQRIMKYFGHIKRHEGLEKRIMEGVGAELFIYSDTSLLRGRQTGANTDWCNINLAPSPRCCAGGQLTPRPS